MNKVTEHKTHMTRIFLVISLLLSAILYGNTIRGEFVFDDDAFIRPYNIFNIVDEKNIWLETPQPKSKKQGIYRPLTSFSFAINSTFFGLRPESYHVTNIVLNAIAGWLLFVFVRMTFKNTRLAVITAVLFLFFPIHTEAVAYIKARDELLAAVLSLLGLLSLLKVPVLPVTFRKYGLASLFFGLAALSKDFGFIMPLVGLVLLWRCTKISRRDLVKIMVYLSIVPILVFLLRLWVLGPRAFGTDINYFVINPLGYADAFTRIFTAGQLAFLYIVKTFIPFDLSATYHFNQIPLSSGFLSSWQIPIGFTVLFILVGIAVFSKTANTPIGIGAILFLLPYFVFSKFIFKWGDMFAERWMYVPSIGLAVIAGAFIESGYKKNKIVTGILFCLMLCIYAGVVIPRNRIWTSKKALAESMRASAPNSVMTYMHLSEYYAEQEKNYSLAKQYADAGMRIYDKHPPLLELSAGIEYQLGNVAKARKLVDLALTEQPQLVGARILDATLLAKAGKYRESISVITENIPKRLGDPLVRYLMAVNWYKLGDYEQAKQYYDWDKSLTEMQKKSMLEAF